MEVKKFTVVREKWFRGRGGVDSALVTKNGHMCCLGFYSAACGVVDLSRRADSFGNPEDHLSEQKIMAEMPYNLAPSEQKKLPEWACSSSADTLANINDNAFIFDDERERQLKEEFAKQGVEVEFV